MDVFIKQLSTGNTVGTRLRQGQFTVSQRNIVPCLPADDFIEPAVTSEAQGIQIPGRRKFLFGLHDVIQRQRALAAAETQLREVSVNLLRLAIDRRRLPKVPTLLRFHPGIKQTLPVLLLGFQKAGAVQGTRKGHNLSSSPPPWLKHDVKCGYDNGGAESGRASIRPARGQCPNLKTLIAVAERELSQLAADRAYPTAAY